MPGRLTSSEKTAITNAANKAAKYLTGKKSSPEEVNKVVRLMESVKGRDKPPVIGKEAIALWSAKIDYAIANGDSLTLGKLTKFPSNPDSLVGKIGKGGSVAWWDNNGGCNCHTGGPT